MLEKKKIPNLIQKAPEAISDRKADPGGARPFGARRLGITFGIIWGAFAIKIKKCHPKSDPKIDAEKTLKSIPKAMKRTHVGRPFTIKNQ